MTVEQLTRDAVLRIGEVTEVNGRTIYVTVDKNKNLSDLFLDGDILRNVAVNGFIEIRKGFLGLIGKVDGEKVIEDENKTVANYLSDSNRSKRVLTISLSGYIGEDGKFFGGTKELPLIGNEAFIVTKEKIRKIYSLVDNGAISIVFSSVYGDDFDIAFPVDGLFNSHIAIFGNTGSGKSNTLAYLYQEFIKALRAKNENAFKENVHIALFDFNGEYTGDNCLTTHKKVYNLTTKSSDGDRLPFDETELADLEMLSILSDATEKTQKPFLARALSFYWNVRISEDPNEYIKNILKRRITSTLLMTEKQKAFLLLDYLREVLPETNAEGQTVDIADDLEWHNTQSEFKRVVNNVQIFLGSNADAIEETEVFKRANTFSFSGNLISNIIAFLYIQLISDVIANRAQGEHIAPVINRLKKKQRDIEKLFDTTEENEFWQENVVVLNLDEVNLDMKKTLPLLISRKLYSEQKLSRPNTSLSLIVDEAHNILSSESFREAENWKDYRLETFEEIIKEGRKFGVFVTISSQRPNDISPTITSQAHNYFIHRLINQKDLATIASAVSYIDRVTSESIPTLPTGTCVFSGIAGQMPLKINVKPLAEMEKPQSDTRKYETLVPDDAPVD